MSAADTTKVTEDAPEIGEAQPERMRKILVQHCLPFNIAQDLNKAIENLERLTTDFENEDGEHFYIEIP